MAARADSRTLTLLSDNSGHHHFRERILSALHIYSMGAVALVVSAACVSLLTLAFASEAVDGITSQHIAASLLRLGDDGKPLVFLATSVVDFPGCIGFFQRH